MAYDETMTTDSGSISIRVNTTGTRCVALGVIDSQYRKAGYIPLTPAKCVRLAAMLTKAADEIWDQQNVVEMPPGEWPNWDQMTAAEKDEAIKQSCI